MPTAPTAPSTALSPNSRAPAGGVRQVPVREERGMRVDAEAQSPAIGEHGGEPIAECGAALGLATGHAPTPLRASRRAWYSWSDVTVSGSREASIEATAAASAAMVVKSALSFATVAMRIS